MNRLLWLFLIVTRLRDRLRCPACGAVGTYKLHAACKGNRGQDVPWRWLCKFCGYYKSSEKSGFLCYPSGKDRVWAFLDDAEKLGDTDTRTPKEIIHPVWPWRG